MQLKPEEKWKVIQSRWTGAWVALPPGVRSIYAGGSFFRTWREALDHAVDAATHDLSLHEVP
jgi:hypothetical protein